MYGQMLSDEVRSRRARRNRGRLGACGLLLVFLLFSATAARGGDEAVSASTPTLAPRLSSVIPQGGPRGGRVLVTIEGKNLLETTQVRFAGPGLSAEIVSTTAQTVKAEIRIGPDVPVGQHDFRLLTPTGSTVAIFQVVGIGEISEQEPNGELESARTIELPAVVNGIMGVSESGDGAGTKTDYDFFRFQADAGQTLVFDVVSTRIGSTADTYVTLFDAHGRELAENADYYQDKDPFLAYEFQDPGKYVLRVGTFAAGGARTAAYRLFIGELPYILHAYPNGGRRGETVEFTLAGLNLSQVEKAVLGHGLATGEVLERSAKRATFRMKIPADLEPRDYRLHALRADGIHTTWPVLFNVDTIPEIAVRDDAARDPNSPVPVSAPIVVSGRIERHERADHFQIEAAAGERFTFEVQGMLLGSLLDPIVLLYDSEGSRIAFQDDPGSNDMWKSRVDLDPHLSHKFEKAGKYRVVVRDLTYRGHPDWVYRLKIRRVEPEYELLVLTPHQTILRGRTTKDNGPDRFDPVHLLVQVRRRGGWDTAVEVWAEELPPGIQGDKITVAAENTYYRGTDAEDKWLDGTRVELPLIASADAPLGSHPVRIRARGVMEGKTVERDGKVLYEYNPTGFMARRRKNALPDEGRIHLTVAEPPKVTVDAPGEITLKQGESEEVEASLHWWGEPEMAVTLRVTGLPQGVRIGPAEAAPGQKKATLIVGAAEETAKGTTRAIIFAEAANGQQTTTLYSRDILITVTNAGKGDVAYAP